MDKTITNFVNEKVLNEVSEGILKILGSNVESIILYGSVARGEATPESDIDIAIIIKHKIDRIKYDDLLVFISDVNIDNNVLFSICDIEKDNFIKRKNILPYYKNIIKEGVVLWKSKIR